MKSIIVFHVALFFLATNATAHAGSLSSEANPSNTRLVILSTWPAVALQQAMVRTFFATRKAPVRIVGCKNDAVAEKMASKKIEIGIIARPLAESLDKQFQQLYGENRVELYPIGRATVCVIVNRNNVIGRLTFEQLCNVISGRISNWRILGGANVPISIFCEPPRSTAMQVLLNEGVLAGGFAPNVRFMRNDLEIMNAVMNDPSGVGIFINRGMPTSGVKAIRLARENAGAFVELSAETVFDGTYPLQCELTAVVAPDASQDARDFCNFMISSDGAKIAAGIGLYPEFQRREYAGHQFTRRSRLGLAGSKIRIAGPKELQNVCADLVMSYVKARSPVELVYTLAANDGASKALNSGKQEMVITDAPLIEEREDGENVSYRLAGRIVAIIVHSTNPLTRLGLEHLNGIYSNHFTDWAELGGLKGKINLYGVDQQSPAGQIFSKGVKRYKLAKAATKADSDAVITAVALDQGGIGFIDYTALRPGVKQIKVLDVFISEEADKGELDEMARLVRKLELRKSTNSTIIRQDYPIVQWYWLSLSNDASTESKELVRYVMGGQCRDSFRQHGLVQLMNHSNSDVAPDSPEDHSASNKAEKP